MARPDEEAIETFMSITGVSEATAIQKLEEHRGNLNEAVNAHFSEGNINTTQDSSFNASQDDFMDIDDPIPVESHRPPSSLFSFARELNPFSLVNPNFTRSIFDSGGAAARPPFISYPREVREIPIEVKDGFVASGPSRSLPTIEDVSETEHGHGPEIRGTVIIDADDDYSFPNLPITNAGRVTWDSSANSRPNAPTVEDVPEYGNDIEEEMIRAAIEASKHETAISNQEFDDHIDLRDPPQPGQFFAEDPDIARAVSLSLQTAEQEKVLRELEGSDGALDATQKSAVGEEVGKVSSNVRQSRSNTGSTAFHDEAEDLEDLPPIRYMRRSVSSSAIDIANKNEIMISPPSSAQQHEYVPHPHQTRNLFPSEAGISSNVHDIAVMLEAMYGGIRRESGYHFPYAPHQHMQNGLGSTSRGPLPGGIPRPPSPSLVAQRLIREHQDDEYLAALQTDRERELKAKEEAEAVLAEENRKEEELRRKLQEEQETERVLAAKEASLSREPTADDENALTILVRMPDGSRRSRRFLKSDKLQCLFDFVDIGRVVKPGSYRLVRPYPRRAFSDGESSLSLHELGLTSKQEALYLEMI